MADQLNQAIQQNLKTAQDKENARKQLISTELAPITTTLTDMASDKLRDIADYSFKKLGKAGTRLFQEKTGINLEKPTQQLEQKAQQLYTQAKNRLPALQQQAQAQLSNTLSQGRNSVANAIDSIRNAPHNPAPHIQQSIERGVGEELEHVKL